MKCGASADHPCTKLMQQDSADCLTIVISSLAGSSMSGISWAVGLVPLLNHRRDIIREQVLIFCYRLWRVVLTSLLVQHLSREPRAMELLQASRCI